ncbi:MAG: hypothetical protein KDK30_03535 [Leptospiraceae bacterium]|nr:hypothetical protein [Leptospiraceae bacterium]
MFRIVVNSSLEMPRWFIATFKAIHPLNGGVLAFITCRMPRREWGKFLPCIPNREIHHIITIKEFILYRLSYQANRRGLQILSDEYKESRAEESIVDLTAEELLS